MRERLVPPRGEVLVPLDEDDVRRAAHGLKAQGVEAIAICFLFSYLDPKHELRARDIVLEQFPEAFVATSARVAPQFREFERFTTAAINAFIGPKVRGYVRRFAGRLGMTVAAAAAGLAVAVGLGVGPRIDDAIVVLGVLIVRLRRNTIPRGRRITREPNVFLVNLVSVAANPALGARAVEIAMARRATASACGLSVRSRHSSRSVKRQLGSQLTMGTPASTKRYSFSMVVLARSAASPRSPLEMKVRPQQPASARITW